MEKKDSKVVPFKNYVLLIVIFIITLGIMTYFCNWYKVYDEFKRQTPVIRGTLFEITSEEELEHYVMENETAVVYLCTASDDNCRNFEKDFIKLIEKKNLQESILYFNLSDIDNKEFVDKFNAQYYYKTKLTENYPAIIIFEDGKIINIIQGTEKEKLNIEKTKQFIEINKIGE